MIREVLVLKRNVDNVGLDIIDEWAYTVSQYLNVPLRLVGYTDAYGKRTFKKVLKDLVRQRFTFLMKPLSAIRYLITRPLHSMQKFKTQNVLPPFYQNLKEPLSIYFAINPRTVHVHFRDIMKENGIPIFLDVTNDEADDLLRTTRNLKLFYVTSRTAFNYIKAQDSNSNVHYMPLSISDKYYSENFQAYRSKTIDVIQLGRRHSVLHNYMLEYCREHKDVEYVYAANGTKFGSVYTSTIKGELGIFEERAKFIDLLSHAKVSLVGTTASDPNPPVGIRRNKRHQYSNSASKGGFISPRFYESAILGCALVGRYYDNQEATELNMRKYCPNITSYEHFCEALEHALAQTPEELYAQNRDFIINSLTSKRAEQIKHDLEELTCTNS